VTAILEQPSSLRCSPRWSTPRTSRKTRGGELARFAAALGKPLMPWQRHVADVALEIDPDTGRLAYRKIALTVPRQSGKTTLLLASMVHRALGFGDRQRIIYTAQTRLKARQKWEDEHLVALEHSPFAALMLPTRKQIGQEAIRWRNGSLHGLEAPSEDAAHGEVLDQGVIDEAFALRDRTGESYYVGELYRLQGELLKSRGSLPEAEASFRAGLAFGRPARLKNRSTSLAFHSRTWYVAGHE